MRHLLASLARGKSMSIDLLVIIYFVLPCSCRGVRFLYLTTFRVLTRTCGQTLARFARPCISARWIFLNTFVQCYSVQQYHNDNKQSTQYCMLILIIVIILMISIMKSFSIMCFVLPCSYTSKRLLYLTTCRALKRIWYQTLARFVRSCILTRWICLNTFVT